MMGGLKLPPASGGLSSATPQSLGHVEAGVPFSTPLSHFSPGSTRLLPQKGAMTSMHVLEHGELGLPFSVPKSHSSRWSEPLTDLPFRRTSVFVSRTPFPQSPGGGTQPRAHATPGLRGQDVSAGSQRHATPEVPGARLQEAGSDVQVLPKSQVSPGETTPSPHSGSLQRPFTQCRGSGQSASDSQDARHRP